MKREWEKWLEPISESTPDKVGVEEDEDVLDNQPEFTEEMTINDVYTIFDDAKKRCLRVHIE